ncbi:MAG: hypothetical protein CMJ58_26065 [Planctomycetaceae bacterium]|nr:hypothetical protein [Planctomycetaceae bacterium]
MTTSPDTPDDAQRRLEEIVAYLDGELPPADNATVEQRLARDESFRQEMQRIERTWNALDELPKTTLDDRFSRTTMEMVVSEAAAEVEAKTMALPVVRRKRRWSTALAATAAALLGFLVVRIARDAPNRALLADLPVVANVDRYQQFQTVDFLRQLQRQSGAELRAATLSGEEVDKEAADLVALARTDDRRSWLTGLDDQQRLELSAQYDRFRALSPEQQQRMRDLHKEVISAEDDPTELMATLIAYRRWLSQLPASEQFELRGMPVDERLQEIKRSLAWQAVNHDFTLSDKELRDFERAFRDAMKQVGASRPRVEQFFGRRSRPGNAPLPADVIGAVMQSKAALPERTQEAFENLATPAEKIAQMRIWIRQARALQNDVSRQELEEYFASDELDEQLRAELLTLPAEQFESRLRQLYLQGQPRWDGPRGDWSWVFPDGGRRDGPPRDGRPPREGERGFGPPPGEFDGRPPEPDFGRGRRGPGPRGPRPESGPPPNGD